MSILDEVRHARILQDIAGVCSTAGIQAKYLHESMSVYCSQKEIEWVRKYPVNKTAYAGLLLVGGSGADSRCQAIVAALLRNFVDARLIPLNTLLESREICLAPTVLAIPNLYVSAAGNLPGWKAQLIYDLLLQRGALSKPTIAFVESMATLKSSFGAPMVDFLNSFYRI
jgi:hypothetical protein